MKINVPTDDVTFTVDVTVGFTGVRVRGVCEGIGVIVGVTGVRVSAFVGTGFIVGVTVLVAVVV